jgi:hypothetical protein
MSIREMFICGLLAIICLQTNALYSQRPLNFNQNFSQRSGRQGPTSSENEGPDSTVYQYYVIDSPQHFTDHKDTLADIGFLHLHSMYQGRNPIINTGNYGAATYSLLYHPSVFTTFTPGYQQYRAYQFTPETFRFYRQNRPMTHLYFSQFGSQENISAGAAFSRNFKNRLSISLNYHRISQKGLYNAQKTRSTAFGVGLRYHSESEKYQMLLLFTNNVNEEDHNGGVLPGADLNEPFRQIIPVLLSEAGTRQQERNFSLTQFYTLSSIQKDQSPTLFVRNHTAYQPSYYKFADKDLDSLDIKFYNGLVTDSRGVRRYLNVDHFLNGTYLHGQLKSGIQGQIGLQLDLFRVNSSIPQGSFWRTDITARFDGKIPIAKALEIDTKARLGLGQNAGNADVQGSLSIKAGKIGVLDAHARFFRSEQTFQSQRLDINDEIVLNFPWTKAIGTVVGGKLTIPYLKSHLSADQILIQNLVYWDTTGLPQQTSDVFSLSRFTTGFGFKFGAFHSDNNLFIQIQSKSLLPIPVWSTSHQMYYHGYWFSKVMEVSAGIDAQLLAPFNAPAFQPLTGNYHLSGTELPLTPLVHVFLMARVSSFRAKFIMENAGQFIFSNTTYLVENHPINPPTLRFAFQWLLKD